MSENTSGTAMPKSVCILRSNPVRPDSRVEKEAWTLAMAGYRVHILAWDRDTDVRESEGEIEVAGVKIPITRLGHRATFGEGFKNLRPYLAFQFHMRKWLKKHRFDIVHACDFDTAFFSRGVVSKKKQRFVFDIFDFIGGDCKTFLQKCVKKAQFRLINGADATIICTEEREKQIKGSHPRRLAVIHNTPASGQLSKEEMVLTPSSRAKIVYVGILQDYRLLKGIAEAVSQMPDVELHVGGFGKYEAYFTEMSAAHDNVIFYGRLPYDKALALERACDIMLAIYDPEIENHRFAAPNKFYESLMLGKPVMMVRGTGMSEVVEQNGIGVLIDYTRESFEEGVQRLLAMRADWPEIGARMQELYDQKYSWDEMRRRLLALYGAL